MDEEKLERLKRMIRERGPMALAFSGGVDSAFLLAVLREVLGDGLLAVTATAAFIDERETGEAIEIAASLGVDHQVIDVGMSDIDRFVENPPDRCYHCKKHLFSKIIETAEERGFGVVCDASNIDDEGDYRPGMKALKELGVLSPLREAGLTKADIRALSREMGLATWNKPAMACLATRIPFGEKITPEKLSRILRAERFLVSLGFEAARVRSHGDLARIEVDREKTSLLAEPGAREKIVEHLRSLGFRYITVDIEGYRTGSLNESLDM
ncbi:MAG: ATP-dependent sacrificial sulfur transferase LarE [Candidatus Krumholzibacteriota bacterium]|nr:ATP-dependent sacrificial sulfur transferase LarE [Candidatus Krumholzibacteriota bacterium]